MDLSWGVTIDSGVGRGFADCLKSKTAPMPTMEAVNDVSDYIFKVPAHRTKLGAVLSLSGMDKIRAWSLCALCHAVMRVIT